METKQFLKALLNGRLENESQLLKQREIIMLMRKLDDKGQHRA